MKVKIISVILAISALITLLCSCQGAASYRDDISSEKIAAEVEKALPLTDGYGIYTSDWAELHGINVSGAVDYCIMISESASDMNEIGIFRTGSAADAEAIRKSAENYLAANLEDKTQYAQNYEASELEKVEKAFVKVMGNYVIYAYLTKSDGNTAVSAIEAVITK